MFQSYEIPNFLSDIDLLFIEDKKNDPATYIANNGKKLNLYQIDLPLQIKEKLSKFGTIVKSEVYELEQPYRIHNDTRNEQQSAWTCIIPLDPEPQGGVTVFNQYAYNFSYSLDPYYSSNYNKVLPLHKRQEIIYEYDSEKSLPNYPEFSHIRDEDKIGFTVAKQFQFEFNKLVAFPSIYFHCSNNVENFRSKSSLVIFTV